MKKVVIRIAIAGLILLILGVAVFAFFLDGIIKKGVETVGPTVTKTSIRLDGVSLSLLSGSASLKGLVVGNPPGYKTPSALEADRIAVKLAPSSVLAEKVIIHSLRIDAARINVEGTPTENNLTKILANIQSAPPGSQPTPAGDQAASKKLQVDDLVISNAKLNLTFSLLGGKATTVALPEIHMTKLGEGPEGITAAELAKRIMTEVTANVSTVATDALKNLGGTVLDATKDVKGAVEGVEKATKGVKDLFKKKP